MKNVDLRTLNKEARKELKRAAIRMFKAGSKQIDIAETLGIRNSTITGWVINYKKIGKISNEDKRGRPVGDGRILSPKQEKVIQKMIIDKTPDQYKLSFALWSNEAIQQLVEREFQKKIPQRTLCDFLHRWKFTPQRPVKLAYEQQPKAVKEWLDETYPVIEKQCIKERGEIHWADETGISIYDLSKNF